MKQFAKSAAEIVRRHLTEEEDDFDVKDVTDHGQDDYWTQIGGDANPWVWGGEWYNSHLDQAVYFPGIDYDAEQEIDSDDVEVPAKAMVKINAIADENERYNVIERYKIARAEFENLRLKHTFWLIANPEHNLSFWLERKTNSYRNPNNLPEEVWDAMPAVNKLLEIGHYIGIYEIGSELKMNYLEAQAMLGSNKI